MKVKPDRNAWLAGGNACCDIPAEEPSRPRRLVLLGAPGAGKGTQAALLGERLGACHLSTGDIFRAAKACCEPAPDSAMARALDSMRRGELVSDETVLSIVAERARCLRCRGGFLLDGFPRTVAQAEALRTLLSAQDSQLDAVLSYELPLDIIVARLSGRRTCRGCKSVFHVDTMPPKVANVCDECGSRLYQREDDCPDSVRIRMAAYERCTAPLLDYYRRQNLLVSIPAGGSPQSILDATLRALNVKHPRVCYERG